MGNCCVTPSKKKTKKKNRQNLFAANYNSSEWNKITVLKNPTGDDISKRYKLDGELGRGEFGITYLAIDLENGEKYACKSISKNRLITPVDIEDVRREVEIMKHLPVHQNVVTLKDTFEDQNAVHIVMELCEGGELFDRIVARGHYTERAASAVMKTIVEVVQTCHRNGVIHRDLKPENFLFANKKETSPLKAIDFGLSVTFKPGERFDEIVGSPYYMAPEVLKRDYGPECDVWSAGVILYILLCGVPPFWAGMTCHRNGVIHRDLKPENFLFANKKETSPLKAIDFGLSVTFKPGERFDEIVGSPYYMAPEVLKRDYGPECDVWSAGVILYILLCGVPPFWAETEQGIAQAIIRSVINFKRDPWPIVSDNAKDLVKKMLDPDPNRRLTAQEVLDHPWIQNAKTAPNVSLGETVKAKLKQFSVMNKLKKKALKVIAEHLSVEESAAIREAFENMDTNKRGKITLEELRVGLQKLGHQVPEADLQILMEAADIDKDGSLNYGEFVAVSVHLRKIANDEHLHKAFAYFDRNQSGYIEIEELRDAFRDEEDADNEEVIKAILHDVDTDKDGCISYEEFAAMMKAGTDWRKASRQYSRERNNSLSLNLIKSGSVRVR